MLAQLKNGQKAKITNLTNTDALVRRRLMDLGITVGSIIIMKYIMPFGGPITIEACGQSVGIRRKEAKRIEVERL